MKIWLLASAMAFFLEGLFIGIAPRLWRRTMSELQRLPDAVLQRIGLGLCASALLLLWLLR